MCQNSSASAAGHTALQAGHAASAYNSLPVLALQLQRRPSPTCSTMLLVGSKIHTSGFSRPFSLLVKGRTAGARHRGMTPCTRPIPFPFLGLEPSTHPARFVEHDVYSSPFRYEGMLKWAAWRLLRPPPTGSSWAAGTCWRPWLWGAAARQQAAAPRCSCHCPPAGVLAGDQDSKNQTNRGESIRTLLLVHAAAHLQGLKRW